MYTEKFYKTQQDSSLRSAESVLPIVFSKYGTPDSMIDIGSGSGPWSKVALELGVSKVSCIEGDWIKDLPTFISKSHFRYFDLEKPLDIKEKYELLICLEVAEHISKARAKTFIQDLCKLSDLILFSAAIPGQSGTNHINEKWLSDWASDFSKFNYGVIDDIRAVIWNIPEIDDWYKQNIVIFKKNTNNLSTVNNVLDFVHPNIYKTRNINLLTNRKIFTFLIHKKYPKLFSLIKKFAIKNK